MIKLARIRGKICIILADSSYQNSDITIISYSEVNDIVNTVSDGATALIMPQIPENKLIPFIHQHNAIIKKAERQINLFIF